METKEGKIINMGLFVGEGGGEGAWGSRLFGK